MKSQSDVAFGLPRTISPIPYLRSASLGDYLRDFSSVHPTHAAILDFEQAGARDALAQLTTVVTEFDSDESGRGDSYRRAQRDAAVRLTGIRQLLHLAAPDAGPSEQPVVLDVLGGDGTLARAIAAHGSGGAANKVALFTSDISAEMVEQALAYGLPAIRQAASFLFLKDASVDGALLAYGTHHIASADRAAAVREALRVVRPGGFVVLHDFAETSPMARFFAEIVDHWSTVGHDYPHFSRDSLMRLFDDAGAAARIVDMYDPLIVTGDSPEAARHLMCSYVADMYGVHRFFEAHSDEETAWRALVELFDHTEYVTSMSPPPHFRIRPAIYRSTNQFVAEIPRVALVAVAGKGSDR